MYKNKRDNDKNGTVSQHWWVRPHIVKMFVVCWNVFNRKDLYGYRESTSPRDVLSSHTKHLHFSFTSKFFHLLYGIRCLLFNILLLLFTDGCIIIGCYYRTLWLRKLFSLVWLLTYLFYIAVTFSESREN